jgi:carbon-monoxide dehydrogenase medium subunit
VQAAVELLAGEAGKTAVLAGGTDLIVNVRYGRDIDLVVDIKRIPEANEMRWEPDGTLVVGACVPVIRVSEDPRVRELYPALVAAMDDLGSYQIRCRATLAGNIGNASPCADTPPVLLVLNARVRIASPESDSEMPLNGFFTHVKKTALKRGGLITAVVIPPQEPGTRNTFHKVKRVRGHDLALLNAAAAHAPGSTEIRLAIGSAFITPVLVEGLEDACPPGAGADEVGDRLAERALASIKPIDDVRASAEYRRDMTVALCHRIARTLLEDAHE